MGRGRQKAKDAKIARQLKYSVHGTDLTALERELGVGGSSQPAPPVVAPEAPEEDEYFDRWATEDDD